MSDEAHKAPVALPRVAITYCTQCKWMLRAAYFGQELLSTFGTSIGEIALIPATGGLFTVHLSYKVMSSEGVNADGAQVQEVLIWDRKAEGGFPETKVLKQRVRNHIEPEKDLGHSDKPSNKAKTAETDVGIHPDTEVSTANGASAQSNKQDCEDCR